jgi:exodeoxyribonuclease VII large subunit
MNITPTAQREVYTVTRLNREVAGMLAGSFPLLWVEGEISNLSLPGSGHMYFSLKDSQAQVRAAMFRMRNMYLGFKPRDGMQVLLRVKVALYEPRGDFQLIVEHMEEAGDGALRRAFEALKNKLAAEGLFDTARKRLPPAVPQRIGIITSPSGAALHDVLNVLCRRYPLAPVLIYPVQVQGADAVRDIASTLALASARQDCDVLLLIRGGGSLEDLSAFNSEAVARAIAACSVPVVCGVGHEVDFTIADFVADVRAPTPSAAAELISPDGHELLRRLGRHALTLRDLLRKQLHTFSTQLQHLYKRLQLLHPARQLLQQQQSLDDWQRRLHASLRRHLQQPASRLAALRQRLAQHSPAARLAQQSAISSQLQHRLTHAAGHLIKMKQQQLMLAARRLDAVSPLATLQRGYAIVTAAESGQPLTRAQDTPIGAQLDIRLAEGIVQARVEQKR